MSARLWLNDTIIYLEIHPDPSEHKPSMFLLTEVGQLGRSGMNSFGMAITANSLMSTDDYVPISHTTRTGIFVPIEPKPVLPISLLRRMFLECAHLSEGLVAIDNFPRHVSNNLTVASADTTCFGMCLEITPDRVYKLFSDVEDAYIVHTNHFRHLGYLSRSDIRDRYPGGSSWFRHQQFTKGVHPHGAVCWTSPKLYLRFRTISVIPRVSVAILSRTPSIRSSLSTRATPSGVPRPQLLVCCITLAKTPSPSVRVRHVREYLNLFTLRVPQKQSTMSRVRSS